MSDFDYADDAFWKAAESEDILVLERLIADIKADFLEIEEDLILGRADWDEYRAQEREREEFRRQRAEFSRWRADTCLLQRRVQRRLAQMNRAAKDQIGDEAGQSARTLIHRLSASILRFEQDALMSEEDLFATLDSTFLVARGKRQTLREFTLAGSRW